MIRGKLSVPKSNSIKKWCSSSLLLVTAYYIEQSFKEEFLRASGYVLVLDRSSFQKITPPIPIGWKYDLPIGDRQAEMRSKNPVAVKYAIKVTFEDFEALLQIEGNSKIEYR